MSRPTQQRRDFRDFVVGNDFRIADVLTFTGAGDLDTQGAVLRLTVRHPTTRAIIGAASTEPGENISKSSGSEFEAVILPDVTAEWPANSRLPYDIQLSFADSDESYSQWYGTIDTLAAITQAGISVPENFVQIFGESDVAFWLDADDFAPALWTDRTENLTVEADPTTVQFDGVDDYMLGTMTTPLAAGSRPYVLIIDAIATVNALSRSRLTLAGPGHTSLLYHRHSSGTRRVSQATSASAAVTWLGPATDERSHVEEVLWPTTLTGHYAVDGSDYDGIAGGAAATNALVASQDQLTLGAIGGLVSFDKCRLRAVVILRSEPTPAQRAAIRAWAQEYRRGPTALPTPLAVVGAAECACQLLAEDASPSSWADQTGNITVTQTTAGQRPVVGSKQMALAAGIANRATALSNGATNTMVGTMDAPLLAGTRPCFFLLFKPVTLSGGLGYLYLVNGPASNPFETVALVDDEVYWERWSNGAFDGSEADIDDAHHVVVSSWAAVRGDRFQLDGVNYTVQLDGTADADVTLAQNTARVEIGAYLDQEHAAAHFAVLAAIRRQPTSDELAAALAYLAWRASEL